MVKEFNYAKAYQCSSAGDTCIFTSTGLTFRLSQNLARKF